MSMALEPPLDPSLVDLAARLARASGEVICRYFRSDLQVDTKDDRSPVTRADREAEAVMRSLLADHAPGHGVIGEELGRDREDAEHVWVLDPIDGTKAFLCGKPLFVTLIALLRDGRPVLGAIHQPILGDLWIGAAGHPTTLSGRPVQARRDVPLAGARISTTGPQYLSAPGKALFERVASRAGVLSYGGDGYQYGLVSSGGLDIVFEEGLKLHDFAAIPPIIEGAGGVVTDLQGRPLDRESKGDVLAVSGPALHADVLRVLG